MLELHIGMMVLVTAKTVIGGCYGCESWTQSQSRQGPVSGDFHPKRRHQHPAFTGADWNPGSPDIQQVHCPFEKEENGYIKGLTKNKFFVGDEVEIISPKEKFTTKVLEILNPETKEIKEFSNTNDVSLIKFEKIPSDIKYALVRTVGIKNERCW